MRSGTGDLVTRVDTDRARSNVRQLQFNRRKAVWIVAASRLLSFAAFLLYEYLHDIIWVRLKLVRVRGIDNVELYGWDRLHYHVNEVGFGVVGKPGSAILVQVYDTDQGLTGHPDHLYLSQLGPWTFTSGAGTVGDKTMTLDEPVESSYLARWIDVGPKGEFGTMLPVKIRNINDSWCELSSAGRCGRVESAH